MRTLSAPNQAVLDDAYLIPVSFVDLTFDDGVLRMHTDLGSITWGGNAYTGAGDLGSIDPIEERNDLSPSGTILRISGLDQAILTEALTQNYYDRRVKIYLGFRDIVTGSLVDDPMQIFSGKMDQMAILSGMAPTIGLAVESDLIEFDRARMQVYSDAELQRVSPGALGFKWLTAMIDAKIQWYSNHYVVFGTHDVISKPHSQHSEKHGGYFNLLGPEVNIGWRIHGDK
jgi:hypothetical protein